jgi:hypothetical protein
MTLNDHWIQKVNRSMEKKGTKGIFKRQAQRRGMTTNRFIDVILKEPKKFSKLERQRATLANTFRKLRNK